MTIMKTLKSFLTLLAAITLSISNMAAQEPTVYMISNAHFDTQWRWDVRQSIGERIKRIWSPKHLSKKLMIYL